MARTRIKICGITRLADAMAAAEAGADAIGFVFHRPSPRWIEPADAATIAAALPPFITTVGLFVDVDPGLVRATLAAAPLDLLQFHGEESPAYCLQFGRPYMKAVRIRPDLDLLQYAAPFPSAVGLLLDAYRPGLAGGTGATFDWELVPKNVSMPIVLSGGLTPDNVADGIVRLQPWAVDVSSGVEAAPGKKDAERIAAFVRAVREADARKGQTTRVAP